MQKEFENECLGLKQVDFLSFRLLFPAMKVLIK